MASQAMFDFEAFAALFGSGGVYAMDLHLVLERVLPDARHAYLVRDKTVASTTPGQAGQAAIEAIWASAFWRP